MLYQLSYSHHAHAPHHDSHTAAGCVERDTRDTQKMGCAAATSAATAFAASTSRPGGGTKTVRR